MQPNASGRHCSSCVQTVVDFTTWELQDIAMYLKKNTGKHTCGRFLNSQLNRPFDLIALAPKVISWHTDGWKKVAALIIVCFALASCNVDKAADNNQDKGQVLKVLGGADIVIHDSISGKQTMSKAITKVRVTKSSSQPIGYEDPYEGHTMGTPEMEYPIEIVPVRTDVPKFQPSIGPPEDTIAETK